MKKSISGLVIILFIAVGCAHRSKSRVIRSSDVGNPNKTKISNFMDAPVRAGMPSERTPGQVSRSVIIDEAFPSTLEDGEICFDITIRTHVSLDVPLTEWEVKIDEQQAYIEEGPISVRDYTYSGERDVFVAEGVTPNAFASMRLTEPTEEIFRVIERQGKVCGPYSLSPQKELILSMVLPQDDLRGSWGEIYSWTMM